MPYDTFWKLNPARLTVFIKAFEDRKKREAQEMDYHAWLIGSYVQVAIGSVFDKKTNYPTEPLSVTSKQEGSNNVKAKAARFSEYAEALNKQIRKKNKDVVKDG